MIITANNTYTKLAVKCSADTFVVKQSFVLSINICGKNRQLLLAANTLKNPNNLNQNMPGSHTELAEVR